MECDVQENLLNRFDDCLVREKETKKKLVEEKKTEEKLVGEVGKTIEEEKIEKLVGEVGKKSEEVVKVVENKCGEVGLAMGSVSNIVAYATIDDVVSIEGCGPTVHGRPLAEENARVSITRIIKGDVMIPFSINDEIVTVQQAVGTYIAWPRVLIVEGNTNSPPVINRIPKRVMKKRSGRNNKLKVKEVKDLSDEEEFVVEMGANFPLL